MEGYIIYTWFKLASPMASKLSKTSQRVLLKCLLPPVATNPDWQRWVSLLGRASAVSFDKQPRKEKKPKCIACSVPFDNYFLLVLHLELAHSQHIEVIRYEFTKDNLVITTASKIEIDISDEREFFHQSGSEDWVLKLAHKDRVQQIIAPIFAKFIRKQSAHRKEYFHSLDVFRVVGAESEDEDSEAEVGQIEQELQRMRISDFTDVNENDKQFFLRWNHAVRQAKKHNVYISDPVLRELLTSLAKKAKQEGIKRINLLMHAWTLWSTGRIESSDVTNLLLEYDKASAGTAAQ